MNLKDFLANRESPPELFWSLVLEPGWVQAGLWFIKGTEAEVVSVGPASPWEAEEDLIGATDAALSSAIQKLPEQSREPSKTVFGVPSAWVGGGEIKEEFLNKIKKVCTELSLDPVGFVVLPEAIANLYKSEEGAPVSAVIVGLGKEFLEIAIFKLGNLVGTTSVARSVSLIEDVNEGLSRFEGTSPLPSRIIVYDGREGEIEEAKDALLSANWEGNEKENLFSGLPAIIPEMGRPWQEGFAGLAQRPTAVPARPWAPLPAGRAYRDVLQPGTAALAVPVPRCGPARAPRRRRKDGAPQPGRG